MMMLLTLYAILIKTRLVALPVMIRWKNSHSTNYPYEHTHPHNYKKQTMSFSPITKKLTSSSRSRRIEDLPPSLVLSMDIIPTSSSSAAPPRRPFCTILYGSGGRMMIEKGTHQMDQAERRRVNMLAVLDAAMAIVDSSSYQPEDGHQAEQPQVTRAGRNTTDAGSSN
jgi:hypothetical protein